MRKSVWLLNIVVLMLVACQTGQAPATPSNEEVATVIEEKIQTLEAGYTATPLPPTPTDIPSTETLLPASPTDIPPTVTASPLPTDTPTVEVVPTITTLPPHYEGKTSFLKIENETGKPVVVYLSGVANYELHFTKDQKIQNAPWGDYYYRVYVGDEGPFVGSFLISNIDKHTLVIGKNRIHFVGP